GRGRAQRSPRLPVAGERAGTGETVGASGTAHLRLTHHGRQAGPCGSFTPVSGAATGSRHGRTLCRRRRIARADGRTGGAAAHPRGASPNPLEHLSRGGSARGHSQYPALSPAEVRTALVRGNSRADHTGRANEFHG